MTNQFYFICYLLSSDSNFGHSFAPDYPSHVADGSLPCSLLLSSFAAATLKSRNTGKRQEKEEKKNAQSLLRRTFAHKKSLLDSWKIQSSENMLSFLVEGGRRNDTLFLNKIFLITLLLFSITTLPILLPLGIHYFEPKIYFI